MTILKIYGAAILLIGFIYFILVRAISTKNYVRKSLWMFIAGLVVTLVPVGGIIYDTVTDSYLFPNGKYDFAYFGFLIVAILFMLFFTIFYLVKGLTRHQRFKNNFYGVKQVKEKKVPTVKEEKGYVYLILKYNNEYFLKKTEVNETPVYSSIFYKFTKSTFFHDDLIKEVIGKLDLSVDRYKMVGTATEVNNKEEIYYCYEVILNELPVNLKDFELVTSEQLLSININDMDKKIIFTNIIEQDFNIEL